MNSFKSSSLHSAHLCIFSIFLSGQIQKLIQTVFKIVNLFVIFFVKLQNVIVTNFFVVTIMLMNSFKSSSLHSTHWCNFGNFLSAQNFHKKVNKKSNKSNMNWTIESNWTRNKLSGQKVEKIHHCALLWSNCSSTLWGMPNFLRWKSTKIKNLELNVFESADFLRPLLNRNP